MKTVSALPKALLRDVQTRLLPWVTDETRILLFQPPIDESIPGVNVRGFEAAPLDDSTQERSRIARNEWPREGLAAQRTPYLGCVLEGEVDLKTGVTLTMQKRTPGLPPTCYRQIVSLPENTFFLVPPGVPVSGASKKRPHWERPVPQEKLSRILWLHILPSGVVLHRCTSTAHDHTTHPFFFSRTSEVLPMVEILQRELTVRGPKFEEAAQAQLHVILLWLERAMQTSQMQLVENTKEMDLVASLQSARPMISEITNDPSIAAFQRACDYIRNNMNSAITVELLANYTSTSPSHLNRIFQRESGMSLMKFVTHYRLERAKTLLAETTLTTVEIAHIVGYRYPAHFSHAFSQKYAVTPTAFRSNPHSHREQIEPNS